MFVVLCFTLTASAGPISIGPIYMSGSGTYSWAYGGGPDEVFSASGSNGSDSVSLWINEGADLQEFIFPGLPSVLTDAIDVDEWRGEATIDGISGEASFLAWPFGNPASWWLGDGSGSISIGDPSGKNLLATASLIGYLDYTNVTETFIGTTLAGVTASFDIDPTPEPASWGLCLVGLAAVASRRGAARALLGRTD
jgi:hypothetical protein